MEEEKGLIEILERHIEAIQYFEAMTYEQQKEINASFNRELENISPETKQRLYVSLLDNFDKANVCLRYFLLRQMWNYMKHSTPEDRLRPILVEKMIILLFQSENWEYILRELEILPKRAFSDCFESYGTFLTTCIKLIMQPETQLKGLRILVMFCTNYPQYNLSLYKPLFKVLQEVIQDYSYMNDDVLVNIFDLFSAFSIWIRDDTNNPLPLYLTNEVLMSAKMSATLFEYVLKFLSSVLVIYESSEINRDFWQKEVALFVGAVNRFTDDYTQNLAYRITQFLVLIIEDRLLSISDDMYSIMDIAAHFSRIIEDINDGDMVTFYLTNYRSDQCKDDNPRSRAVLVTRKFCELGHASQLFEYLTDKNELQEIDLYLLSVVVQYLGDLTEYMDRIYGIVRRTSIGSLESLSALALVHSIYERNGDLPKFEPCLETTYSFFTPQNFRNRKLKAYEQLLFLFSVHFMAIKSMHGVPMELSYVYFCLQHQECLFKDDLIVIISGVLIESPCKESYELYEVVLQQIETDLNEENFEDFKEYDHYAHFLMACLQRVVSQSYDGSYADATVKIFNRILMTDTDLVFSLDLPLSSLLVQDPSRFIPVIMGYIQNIQQNYHVSDVLVKPLVNLINNHPELVMGICGTRAIIGPVLETLRRIEFLGEGLEDGTLLYNLSTLAVRMNAVGGDFEWGELFGELVKVVSKLPEELRWDILVQIELEIECYRFSQEDAMSITECLLKKPSLPLSFVYFAKHVFEANNILNEICWAVLEDKAITTDDDAVSPLASLSDVDFFRSD